MRTYLQIIALCLISTFTLYSQGEKVPTIDSIERALKRAEKYQSEYKVKESFEEASRAIDLATEADNKYYLILIYNLIGINYENILDYENAEKNYQKALQNALTVKNDTLTGWLYNNLGNVYTDGYKKIDEGIDYYKKSLSIAESYNDTLGILTPVLNIGWTYVDTKDFDTAYPHLMKAKTLIDKMGGQDSKLFINYLLGIYYSSKDDDQTAETYFNEALRLGENGNYVREMQDIYLAVSNHYKKKGEINKAFDALEKYNEFRNKLFDEDKLKRLEVAKARFDADEYRRDLEIAQQESAAKAKIASKSRQITIITGFSSIILLILLILLYMNSKSKNEINTILKQRNKELEEAKIEAERLFNIKSQFIATVSHELRTPLYGVVGLTSLLLEEKNLSKKEDQYLKSLKFSGDYLLNLINDVLQLSKIDSNKVVIAQTTFNVKKITHDIVESFEFHIDHKNNNLHFNYDEEIPCMLIGDSVRLSQILINLIGNATKFTHGGNIWFTMRKNRIEGDEVWVDFEIQDDGPGIPDEQQDEIFENFSQLQREDGNYSGTGLGLSIVKKLILLFGSEIKLDSKEGEGAKFSFTLKFGIDDETPCDEAKENTQVLNHGKNKILVVEDNKINQIVTMNILQKENFDCVVVDNGVEAVEAMKGNHFDLVLMDLNMPKMNGAEASQKIREFNTKTPIIALTALQVDEIGMDFSKVGINDVINKPYDKHEFYQVILKNLHKEQSQD